MSPCPASAATRAASGSTPSRRTSMSATASACGVRSTSSRQRERMVGSTSCTDGAQSSHTVRGEGSSTPFSRALAAASVRRWAASTRITDQRPPVG